MGKVLIVDDHLDQCRPLMILMRHLGHEAWCLGSAAEALEFLRGQIPDVLVLDVMMPGMDGMELLALLRRSPQTSAMPVVMYSALSDPNYQRYVLSKGANDYWVKGSTDLAVMEERLRRFCNDPAVPVQ
jgi:CheY-like chemotaxis protein